MTFIAGSDHGDYFDPLFLSFSRREKGRSGQRRSYRTTLKKRSLFGSGELIDY